MLCVRYPTDNLAIADLNLASGSSPMRSYTIVAWSSISASTVLSKHDRLACLQSPCVPWAWSKSLRGSELREWRKILGYTQEQAGKALGVTRATIQNWEYELSSIPVAVQLACSVLLRRWKQRPEFGPVTVAYTGVPLSLAAQARPKTRR